MRGYKLAIVTVVFSFLGGIVGGWVAQHPYALAVERETVFADEVVTKSLTILNDKNHPAARIVKNQYGGGVVALYPGNGKYKPTVHLSALGNGGQIAISDPFGNLKASINSDFEDVSISLIGHNNKRKIAIGVVDNTPSIDIAQQ